MFLQRTRGWGNPPAAAVAFLHDVLATGRGWTLIVVGVMVGFVSPRSMRRMIRFT